MSPIISSDLAENASELVNQARRRIRRTSVRTAHPTKTRGTSVRLHWPGFLVAVFVLALTGTSPAQTGLGPQGVVRRFCQLDSLGQRVATLTWPAVAPLIEWPLEPVWDHAVLIGGYQVGPPFALDAETMGVEVHYSVVGEISANGQGDQAYLETVLLRVRPDDNGSWRIMGPPPSPHLFASGIDIAAARRAIQPGQPRFPTSSDFVWQMFRAAGWDVEYETTADLGSGRAFRRVDGPKPGDLVVYLRDGVAYHAGILNDEGHATSATINAGILRTAIEMFAGEVRYLRLVEPRPTPTEAPTEEVEARPTPTPEIAPATPRARSTPPARRPPKAKSRKTPIATNATVAKAPRTPKPKVGKKPAVTTRRHPAIVGKPTPKPGASRRSVR